MANNLNLHPAFSDNRNNPAIDNVESRIAIEGSGGVNRRTSGKHSKTISKLSERAISKLNNSLLKGRSTRRRLQGGERFRALVNPESNNQLAIIGESGDQQIMTYNNVPPTAVQNQQFQQQQRHNFNYNLPQQPPVGIEVVDETPMESLQQAAVEMSRPREAITYYPGLTRKQQQRKALRSAKVREKSLTLYNRKQKDPLTETNAPPVGVLRAIAALPQPDVPAIEAGHLRLAIQDWWKCLYKR